MNPEQRENTQIQSFGLAGRVVMVTGGGSGIGRETSLLAAADGARVAVCDVNPMAAEAVSSEANRKGGYAIPVGFDVTDSNATRQSVHMIEDKLGPIHGLVAAAGISRSSPAELMEEDTWDQVIAVNLTGVFHSCQAVGRQMIVHGGGSIVAIASGNAFAGHAGRAHYCASKHGVVGLTRTLAIEWGRHHIRVNALAPGAVDTPLLRGGLPEDFIEEVMVDRTPMARLATARDQALASLFLLSDASSFISGVILPVDGGFTSGYLTRWKGADYSSKSLLAAGKYSPPPKP